MIDKLYTLSQFYYKKKEYKQAFLLMRKALEPKVLAAGEALTVQVFPNTYQFQLLKQHLKNDEMFLNNNLLGVMGVLRKIQDNHLPLEQKEKLYKFINESSTLYRDQHIVVRKKIALLCYFDEDYSEIIQNYCDQPRVQLKYFQQAFKLLADYLGLFEEGVKVYKQYAQRNPNSIEGYDCLDAVVDDRVALWQEFINKNPHNQNGYARLISLSPGNEAKILQLYILNNPDDLFGYEQLCLLEQDENVLDAYLEKHQSWLGYDKKCALAFQIKRQFCPIILEKYFEKHDKYPIILSDLEQIKLSNQILSGYQLEKIKFYFNTVLPNDSISEKLQNLQTVEQRKKLITQIEIIIEAIQLLVPLVYSINEINQKIEENKNEIKYYQQKANYFYQLNQLDKALQVYDDFILLHPNFKSYEEKAQFMKYKCKPLLIKQYWEKFIQCCNESDPDILLQKAEILTIVLKQHDKALVYFEKFIQLQPFSEIGYLAKIKLLSDQGRQKELLKTIDEYLQINSNNEKVQILKIQMLSKIYNNEVALQYIDTLNFKDSVKLLEVKARMLGENKKEVGLKFINDQLDNQPQNWKIEKIKLRFLRDYFGNIYIDNLRELIKQNPHNIKYYICFYKMTIDEHILYDEVRDQIDRYIETHPDQVDNHQKLKQLLQK